MARSNLSQPFDLWPDRDKALWSDAFSGSETYFGKSGLGVGWRPSTRLQVEKGYSLWLGHLTRTKAGLDHLTEPHLRLTPNTLGSYSAELENRVAPATVASRLRDLHEALRIMVPGTDLAPIKKAVSYWEQKGRARRIKADHLVHPRDLFKLGLRLMDEASTGSFRKLDTRACRYRDGLMIALLAVRPIRLSNLVSITLGQHLEKIDGRYWLRFSGDETKNGRQLEAVFPSQLTQYIDRYMDQYREDLRRGANCDALWLSTYRGQISQQSARLKIRGLIEKHLGVRIPPHWFRDCAATWLAIESPDQVRSAARVLGHADFRTTERHYNQANSVSASRIMNKAFEHHLKEAIRISRSS